MRGDPSVHLITEDPPSRLFAGRNYASSFALLFFFFFNLKRKTRRGCKTRSEKRFTSPQKFPTSARNALSTASLLVPRRIQILTIPSFTTARKEISIASQDLRSRASVYPMTSATASFPSSFFSSDSIPQAQHYVIYLPTSPFSSLPVTFESTIV